jgi:hypothetical protein
MHFRQRLARIGYERISRKTATPAVAKLAKASAQGRGGWFLVAPVIRNDPFLFIVEFKRFIPITVGAVIADRFVSLQRTIADRTT